MFDIQIKQNDNIIGVIRPDGFYTDDPDLTSALQRIFDGEGAITLGGWTTPDGGSVDGITFIKPEDPEFESAMLGDLMSLGYSFESVPEETSHE